MNAAKEEALRALTHALEMLDDSEPMDELRRVQLRALLKYAEEQTTAIQVLKRQRRIPHA